MPSIQSEAIAKILEKTNQQTVYLRAVLKILQSMENITLSQIQFSFQDNKAARHNIVQRLFPLGESRHDVTDAHDHP